MKKAVKKTVKPLVKISKKKGNSKPLPGKKLSKFEKFDLAEKEIKEAEDAVQEVAKEVDKDTAKDLLIRAARDLEKAEAEVEEADESCF